MRLPDAADIDWPVSHRIIRTIYPPVNLFEDIASPADWELIAAAESRSNPRVRDQVGELNLVPVSRRIAGPTATLVMGAFTHASRARPSRFTNGSFGVWYCGNVPEVALAETIFHHENFMRATDEPAGVSDYRELVNAVGGLCVDLRGGAASECLTPDNYRPGQELGQAVHDANGDGIVYPSVRWPGGQAVALMWPDRIRLPVRQSRQFRYFWTGRRVDRYFVHGSRSWTAWP